MNKNEYKVNTYVLIKNGEIYEIDEEGCVKNCLLYTSPSPRDTR